MPMLQVGQPAAFGSFGGSGVGFSNAQQVTPGMPGSVWDAQARGLAGMQQPYQQQKSPLWQGFADMLAGKQPSKNKSPMGPGGGQGMQSSAVQGMQSGIAPVTTTIDAGRDIYDPNFIQRAVNQQVGQAHTMGDPRYQMERFTRPGMSRDAGTMAAAMPGIAGAQAAASDAQTRIPLEAELANRQHRLSGETARAGEANALGSLMSQLQRIRDSEQSSLVAPLLDPAFMSIFG